MTLTELGPGLGASVVYGPDGLALIAYQDLQVLKVAHCHDVGCTAATLSDLGTPVSVTPSVAIGADGLGLISYCDTSGALNVAHCGDPDCSTATVSVIGACGSLGRLTDLVAGSDGLALVAYGYDEGSSASRRLRVAHCQDVACTSASTTEFPSSVYADNPSLTLAGDGLALLASDEGFCLDVGHCADVACSSASFISVCGPPPASSFCHGPALATAPDGRGVLAYACVHMDPFPPFPETPLPIQLRTCADVACSSVGPATAVSPSTGSDGVALALAGSLPLIAHADDTHVNLTRCKAPDCSSHVFEPVAPGLIPAIALSPEGRPLVVYSFNGIWAAYLEPEIADLRLTKQATPSPVGPGQVLTYSLGVTNQGFAPATQVVLTDPLPAGFAFLSSAPGPPTCSLAASTLSCALGDLSVGDSAAVQVTGRVSGPIGSTLVNTAAVSSTPPDLDAANDVATTNTVLAPIVSVGDASVVEGDTGLVELSFPVRLSEPAGSIGLVSFATAAGTATASVDFISAQGTLSFLPGESAKTASVSVVGDTLVEPDETLFVDLANPFGLAPGDVQGLGVISDDDAPALSSLELSHGSSLRARFAPAIGPPPGAHYYRLAQQPRSSYEVVLDDVSGDVPPLALQRLAANNADVLQDGAVIGAGTGRTLRWENTTPAPITNQHLRVRSDGCGPACGRDDVYRIRAYETTLLSERLNNTASQLTVVVLANTDGAIVTGNVWLWDDAGLLLERSPFSLPPRGSLVLDTSSLTGAFQRAGSVSVTHDAGYASLVGKVLSIEPATGFSFETPLAPRGH